MRIFLFLIVVTAMAACQTVAEPTGSAPALPIAESGGCMEGPLAQFGQYLGQWTIEDEQFQPDGSGWKKGPGAYWDWVCVGDGTAIQDFWMPNGGPVGTNLRTYHPEKEAWDIAWSIKGQPGFSHIAAKQHADGNIVMSYLSPPQDPPRKITFFPATDNAWKWKLELSFDGGENWTEVYRINATRRQ